MAKHKSPQTRYSPDFAVFPLPVVTSPNDPAKVACSTEADTLPVTDTAAEIPPVATPRRQFALQAAATIAVLSLVWPYYGFLHPEAAPPEAGQPLPWMQISLGIGLTATLFATLTRQPWWWRLIHALFAPLLWAGLQLSIDPGWFLLGFMLLLLVYRGALSGQVPLYLSNPASVAAIASRIPANQRITLIDLGAGIGSSLIPLARLRPDCHFVGVENAPLTWLIGWFRTRGQQNLDWRWGSLWQASLGEADIVYAFLSPVPMPDLWDKARAEMRPGTLFLSNTFAVPEVEPEFVIDVDCTPARPLYGYRLP